MSWYLSQWSQVREGGLHVLHRKMRIAVHAFRDILLRTPLFLLNAVWAIPAVVLIRIVRPWRLVRLCTLCSWRCGHFVVDASLYLAQQSLQPAGSHIIDLFWFPVPTTNKQWERMVRRKLFVRWWVRYLIFFNKIVPGGAAHALPTHFNGGDRSGRGSRDVDMVLEQSAVRFEFASSEDEEAKAWLRRKGWQEGESFVCLLIRDSAYSSGNSLGRAGYGGGDQADAHSHRNVDVDAFSEVVQELVDEGYWVVRMGKVMHKRFPLKHPKIIDYPFIEDQEDLLDIWLPANCQFFISTGAGIDTVSNVYNRPVVYVDYLPLGHLVSYVNGITIPRHLRWKKNGNKLTLQEHLKHSYSTSGQQYERAGILIEDASSAEIVAVVRECKQRLARKWVETEDDLHLQSKFWEELRSWSDFHRVHNCIHPEARVGCAWLRSMEH